MKLCTTTGDFHLHCNNDIDKLKEVSRAGFKYVDFSMYDNEVACYMHEGWKDDIKRLKDTADQLGIKFVQAHSPAFETLETLDPNENWEEKLKQTIRSIEICALLDIPMTVVHAGVKRNTPKEETLKLNKEFYDLLLPTMEKTGVIVLCENVGIADNNGRHYLNSGERLREFVEYYNHPLLQACWDIGHGNVFGNQYENILAVGKYLRAIHYNDNDKKSDLHTIPFLSELDNDDAMRGLLSINFDGPFTFECTSNIQRKLKQFDNKIKLDNLSLDLLREYEKALYQTGKYLLTAYNVFEE